MAYDTIIIGAGIVGLATARALLKRQAGLKLLVLEKELGPAHHQTGHNSGVLHSGIYYKPGSEKARNCTAGYRLMLDYLREKNIPHDICGKIIVATDDRELPALQMLKERGEKNGLNGLRLLSAGEAREIEPHVQARQALWVPQAGIVDYTEVAKALVEDIRQLGGEVRFGVRAEGIQPGVASASGQLVGREDCVVETTAGEFSCSRLINCGGLYSDRIGKMAGVLVQHRIVPFRGEYYELKPEKAGLVRNLIYPVPDLRFPFLGVHFTRMMKGGVEAGPNAVFALSREGYRWSDINLCDIWDSLSFPGTQKLFAKFYKEGVQEVLRSLSKARFAASLQKLIPEITADDLVPGGAGVRAQALKVDGQMVDDFLIVRENQVIHVFNAPSPAATSSLAIGESIAALG